MDIFNHYLLKELEHGIPNKLFRKKPTAKIGLSEPEPLAIRNVMFPFSCLGFCMIVSVVMAAVEFLVATLVEPPRGRGIRGAPSNNAGAGIPVPAPVTGPAQVEPMIARAAENP